MSVKCRRPASGPSFDFDFDFVSWRIHVGSTLVSGDGGVRWGCAMNRRSDCYDGSMFYVRGGRTQHRRRREEMRGGVVITCTCTIEGCDSDR